MGESRGECPESINTKAKELSAKVNRWDIGVSEAIQDMDRK